MYTPILVIAVFLHAALAQTWYGMQCTSSNGCPAGSKCVDSACIDCTCDPFSCIRSMEACKNLNCKEDEGCYLNHVADAAKDIVTVTLKCGKKEACTADKCQKDEKCIPLSCGKQPPTAKCLPTRFVDPCKGVTCPAGYTCSVNSALCSGVECNSEVVCTDLSACKDCSHSQTCDLQPKAGSDSKPRLMVGKCVEFLRGGPLMGQVVLPFNLYN